MRQILFVARLELTSAASTASSLTSSAATIRQIISSPVTRRINVRRATNESDQIAALLCQAAVEAAEEVYATGDEII